MTDLSRVAPEGETPVNPYSLLEAVNDSSDTAHTAWLIFLAVMIYFMIAVAGVTHRDLLLETPVNLPVLQVAIPVTQFFQFAPVILVLMHLGVLSQLVLLARKTIEFDHAIRLLETTNKRTHPLRLELNNFFFVQAVAGPHRSAVMGAFLHGMSWLTLMILPVVLILYIQVSFLPYHDQTITWTHRIALLVDITMLLLIGVFLMRAETSFFQAFWRSTLSNPVSAVVTTGLLALAAVFSLVVATIPGEPLDRVTRALLGTPSHQVGRDMRQASGVLPSLLNIKGDGSLFGLVPRWLVVSDTDLVSDKDVINDEPTLNLRGRDLRLARLDRSDLHQADLTGAILDGASLAGADLSKARLGCADINELLLSDDRALAKCTSARRAILTRAKLNDAALAGIDLRGAKLDEARLEGAELPYALLTGANLSGAHLDRADMTGGVQAKGANFLIASMLGTDLTGAQLQLATLSNTAMQGAVLAFAQLQGASLRDADLEGASLYRARLEAADLTGARIAGADLRGAHVWMSQPPAADTSGVADFTELVMRPLDEGEVERLKAIAGRIDNPLQRAETLDGLGPLMDIAGSRVWAQSADQGRWQALVSSGQAALSDGYKVRITDYLSKAMCRTRFANGSVATGIARRAQAQGFRGDAIQLYERLRSDDCPAGKLMASRVLREFASVVEILRAN